MPLNKQLFIPDKTYWKLKQERKDNMKKLLAFILIILTLNFSSPVTYVKSSADLLARVDVYEEFDYTCYYSITGGYRERDSHGIYAVARNMQETVQHNLTVVVQTREKLRNTGPEWAKPENRSLDGGYSISAAFQAPEFQLYISLTGCNESYPDPFDLLILPEGLSLLPIETNGRLVLDVSLTSNEAINNADISVGPASYPAPVVRECLASSDLKIEREQGRGDFTWRIPSMPAGNHHVRFESTYNALTGDVVVKVFCQIAEKTTLPVFCYLDGKQVDFSKKILLNYRTSAIEFAQAVVPWIYGYTSFSSYLFSFKSPQNFPLRIDAGGREKIDSIILSSDVKDVRVVETEAYNNACYNITLISDGPSESSIRLVLNDKVWFIIPNNIGFADIPKEIVEKYTDPSSLQDGKYIDKDSPIVQLWSRQVVGEEKNPYRIAYLLYQNLTVTLNYTKSYEEFQHENEFASATLKDRAGVCRHFARAFAALCMASKLQVRTVIGTGLGMLGEIHKKNHEWNEVFFPGYGWVTIDVTSRSFGRLTASHMVYTFWPYLGDMMNVSQSEKELIEEREKSAATLSKLASIIDKKLEDLNERAAFLPYVNINVMTLIENSKALLCEARLLAYRGLTHEALLKISRAYMLIAEAQSSLDLISFTIIAVILLCGVALLIERKKIRKLLQFLQQRLRRLSIGLLTHILIPRSKHFLSWFARYA